MGERVTACVGASKRERKRKIEEDEDEEELEEEIKNQGRKMRNQSPGLWHWNKKGGRVKTAKNRRNQHSPRQ